MRELEGSCTDSDGRGALVVAAWRPSVGQPIKIMAVGDGGGDLTVTDPHGDEKALTTVRRDGRRPACRRSSPRRARGPSADLAAGRQADRVPQDPGRREAGGAVDRASARTSGRRRTRGIGATRTCTRRGSRRCSMRPSISRWTSGRCTRRCAIRRATSCTVTSACARTIPRTRRRSRRRPTAPTCRTSCARIFRGSSGCRSGSGTATAGTNRGRRAARRSTATTTRRPARTRWPR